MGQRGTKGIRDRGNGEDSWIGHAALLYASQRVDRQASYLRDLTLGLLLALPLGFERPSQADTPSSLLEGDLRSRHADNYTRIIILPTRVDSHYRPMELGTACLGDLSLADAGGAGSDKAYYRPTHDRALGVVRCV